MTRSAATMLSHFIAGGPSIVFVVVCGVLVAALLVMPRPARADAEAAPPWWDLPLRVVTATTMVVLITTAAASLGPAWSGLLSPFPVFSSVLAAFAHHMSGPDAAARLQRGVVVGIFSFAAFFLVVALLIDSRSMTATYGWATVTAIAVNSVSLVVLWRARR
jgi:uncharacterized membrane protein (GlpM family)